MATLSNKPPLHLPFSIHNPKTLFPTTTTTAAAAATRRRTTLQTIAITASILLQNQPISNAFALDFRMTTPDQTLEEAENGIQEHAKSLLSVKELLEEDQESFKEAQKVLRKSSSYLKQDIYTIIQGKPGNERPLLRKLYSNLFNSVTRLDYAARDKDLTRVWECYDNVVVALNDILSRI